MDQHLNGAKKNDGTDISRWAVVKYQGGAYLGVVASELPEDATDSAFKTEVVDKISQGDCLEIKPCFDFIAPLRPMQKDPGGPIVFMREPVILPADFAMQSTSFFVKATGVMFLSDLQGEDKNVYKGFVDQVLSLALQKRAEASGLKLVHSMPNKGG